MSGSNFTEGGGKQPHSAAPGGKSPVLLGLSKTWKLFYSFLVLWKSFAPCQYHPPQPSYVPLKESLSLFARSFLPFPRGSPFTEGDGGSRYQSKEIIISSDQCLLSLFSFFLKKILNI